MSQVAELLSQAVERHHPRLVMLCSFQKEESVLVDELVRVAPDARIVTIDTGVLFPETLATWRAFESRFGVEVEVEDATGAWGAGACCGDAKVAALERALAGADARITGIRPQPAPPRPRAGTPGSPAPAASRRPRAPARSPSSSTSGAGSGSTTRSWTGPSATCGAASPSATCPITRSTTRGTPPSAARRAPHRAPAGRGAGPARRRRSAACTSDGPLAHPLR